MNRSPRSLRALAAAGCLLSALVGCAVDDTTAGDGEQTGGQASGSVVIACTPQEEQCQAATQAFTEATGIEANYVRMSSGEAIARLDAAKSKPEFDMMYGGPSDGHIAAFEAGLTEKYVSPNAEQIPDKFKAADGTWTGIYVGVLGFCSNTDVLDKIGAPVPESWADLLDPQYKGQIAIAHPSTSGTSYAALWTQMVLHDEDVDKTFDYLADLHKNILQYSKSGSAPGQMAGRGEIAVGLIFSHDCVKYIKEGFDMLETSFPSEGTGYEIGAVSLIKGGPNPINAKKFIDWTLTAEHQNIGPSAGSFQVPTNPDATITDDMADLESMNLVEYDSTKAGQMRKELTTRFDSEIASAPKE